MLRTMFLAFVVALAGCGGSATLPVEGIVLLDGKPLANAAIQFVPDGAGRDATGQTDSKGAFRMSTIEPGDGVMPGSYKVVISPPAGEVDATQYASADEAMAAASKPSARKKPVKSAFPQKYTRLDQTPLTQAVPTEGILTIELSSK